MLRRIAQTLTTFTILVLLMIRSVQAQDDSAVFDPPPPLGGEVITPESAPRLERLSTLGRGIINGVVWSPSGSQLAVKSSIGLWMYDVLNAAPYLIEGVSNSAAFDEGWNKVAIGNGGNIDIWDLQRREKWTIQREDEQRPGARLFMSADGTVLISFIQSTSFVYQLQRWDITHHELRDSLLLGDDYIEAVRLSPMGDVLLIERSTEADSLIRLGDTLESVSLYDFTGHPAWNFHFHPTQPWIAFQTNDRNETVIHLFNYETEQEIASKRFPRLYLGPNFFFFSPQGNQIFFYLSASQGPEFYRWEFNTGEFQSSRGETRFTFVPDSVFSPDQRYLVLQSNNRSEVWDLASFQPLEVPWGGGTVIFDPSGQYVAASRGTLRLYSLADGTSIRDMEGYGTASFQPDGSHIAVAAYSERSLLIYPTTMDGDPLILVGYGPIGTLGFLPQGDELLMVLAPQLSALNIMTGDAIPLDMPSFSYYATQPSDSSLHLSNYDIDTSQLRQWTLDQDVEGVVFTEGTPFDFSDELSHNSGDRIVTYALDPANEVFVAAGGEDTEYYGGTPYLFVRDLKTGRYQVVYGHTGTINTVVLSPDGRTLATGSGYITEGYQSDDTSLRLWDVRRIDNVLHVSERARFYYSDSIFDAVFSSTGRLIAAAGRSVITVRDTLTGRELLHADTWNTHGLAFSPDERLLVAQMDFQLVIWDIATGEMLAVLPTLSWQSNIYFDPTGRWIVLASNTGILSLYGVVAQG